MRTTRQNSSTAIPISPKKIRHKAKMRNKAKMTNTRTRHQHKAKHIGRLSGHAGTAETKSTHEHQLSLHTELGPAPVPKSLASNNKP